MKKIPPPHTHTHTRSCVTKKTPDGYAFLFRFIFLFFFFLGKKCNIHLGVYFKVNTTKCALVVKMCIQIHSNEHFPQLWPCPASVASWNLNAREKRTGLTAKRKGCNALERNVLRARNCIATQTHTET